MSGLMPSGKVKKGAILQCYEESLRLLGIIRRYRKYPKVRSEV